MHVGQNVVTPRGPARVVSDASGRVLTTKGAFDREKLMLVDDATGVTSSLETLEDWLERPQQSFHAAQILCTCPCGKNGHCYRVQLIDETDQQVTMRNHIANTACRCKENDCGCV